MSEPHSDAPDPQWWAEVVDLYGADPAEPAAELPPAAQADGLATHRSRREGLRAVGLASLIALPLAGAALEDTVFPAVPLAAALLVLTWLAIVGAQWRRGRILERAETLDIQAHLRTRASVLRRARAHWRLTFAATILITVLAGSAGAWSFLIPVASMALSSHLPWLLCALPSLAAAVLAGRRSLGLSDELRALGEFAEDLELSLVGDTLELERNWTQVIALSVVLVASLGTALVSAFAPTDWSARVLGEPLQLNHVLIVSDTPHTHAPWLAGFEFEVDQRTPAQIEAEAEALFGRRGTTLERTLAVADHGGYGVLLYDLRGTEPGHETLTPTRFRPPNCRGWDRPPEDLIRSRDDSFVSYRIDWLGSGCYLNYGSPTRSWRATFESEAQRALVEERSALGHALFDTAGIRYASPRHSPFRWATAHFEFLDNALASGRLDPAWLGDDPGFEPVSQ